MEKRISEVLKEIGLGKAEVDVYIDLLRSKASTATDISKRTYQHRSNVYDALRRLQNKSFIKEIVSGSKKLFEANNPEIIATYLKQKESEIKTIITYLNQMVRGKNQPDSICVSYGLTQVRALLEKIHASSDEIIVWGSPPNIGDFLGDAYLEELRKERIKRKKTAKILYSEYFDRVEKISRLPYQEVRFIKRKINKPAKERRGWRQKPNAVIVISRDMMVFITFSKPIMVVETGIKDLIYWFTSQFYAVWEKASQVSLEN